VFLGARRDMVFQVGSEMWQLNDPQAVVAWRKLAGMMEDMQTKDIPKFKDLLCSIRAATLIAQR
jgi:hypothetical protein